MPVLRSADKVGQGGVCTFSGVTARWPDVVTAASLRDSMKYGVTQRRYFSSLRVWPLVDGEYNSRQRHGFTQFKGAILGHTCSCISSSLEELEPSRTPGLLARMTFTTHIISRNIRPCIEVSHAATITNTTFHGCIGGLGGDR